jgi:hypothetical protein
MGKVHGYVELLDAEGDERNAYHGICFFAEVSPEGYADVELLIK